MAKKLEKSDKFYGLIKAFKRGELRDTGRALVVLLKNDLEIDFDPKTLNSWEDVYSWILRTIKSYNCKDDNKAFYKEIDALKEEIAILTNSNFLLTKKNVEIVENREVAIDFIKEAEQTKIELKLQKFYTKAFAVTLSLSVLLNILLIWGNL